MCAVRLWDDAYKTSIATNRKEFSMKWRQRVSLSLSERPVCTDESLKNREDIHGWGEVRAEI